MNPQKRKKNIIISCCHRTSLRRRFILASVCLGFSFPFVTSEAEDSLPSSLSHDHLSDSSSNEKVLPKPLSRPQLSHLPVLDKIFLPFKQDKDPAVDHLFPITHSSSILNRPPSPPLKQDENHIAPKKAASTTAQGKVEPQKILIEKETQTLSTDTSKKTTL